MSISVLQVWNWKKENKITAQDGRKGGLDEGSLFYYWADVRRETWEEEN